ncbi:MAG: CHRD domain-containing protein [Acidobacteriota bacterium]
MKKLILLLAALAASAFAQRSETVAFLAALSPQNEVPPVAAAAGGTALLYAHVVRDAQNQIVSGSVDFVILYTFLEEVTFTGLHIHAGAAGVNGPVTVNTGIAAGANAVTIAPPFRGVLSRQAQVLPDNAAGVATLRGLFENPAGYYVNLHTTVFPGGVIRGQVMRAETTTLLSLMSPANEVPAITNVSASGVGAIEAVRAYSNGRLAAGVVTFDVNYTIPGDSTITGLHIHTGAAGINGPVIFNTGIPGTASVTAPSNGIGNLVYPVEVNAANAAQVTALEGLFDSPADYYINLHTSTNPGGLIRSQMFDTEEISFRTMMSPANEVPAVTGLDASAMGNALIYALRDRTGNVTAARFIFDVNYRFPGATTFTGLHVHDAAAGVNGPVSINSNIAAGERAVVSPGGFGNIWRPVNLVGGQPLTSLNSLLRNPENHYLNLHTTVHAGGAVRAQLAPAITRMPRIVDVISAVSDSRLRTLAPGGQFTIFGEDLAKVPTALGGLVGLQLPRAANGTSVTMGGIPVPIITLGFEARNNPSGYIVGQVPFEAPAGTHDVIVTSANGASNRFQVTVAPVAPAMFVDAVGAFAVRVADFSIVRPESAARAGETIAFVTTGLGQTMPMLATGQIPDAANLVAAPVTLSIGGRDAMVMGATTIAGYPGIYIVLANIPTGVAPGPANVMLRVGTVTANVTSLAVR